MTYGSDSLCCIVPPHILREIAQRGDAGQRARAQRTLALSEQMRARRQGVGVFPAVTPVGRRYRTVYDAQNGSNLPGVLVRGEGDPPTNDPAANEAYDGAGETYDLFLEEFNRNSIDGRGMRLDSTVHFELGYDNAFWDGGRMVYGDGDGVIFGRFTRAIDVIGHELTHGVTEHETKLIYEGQSGALNEHISDVFGSLVKQRHLGQTSDQADWLIGQGLFQRSVHGVALRSMKAPGTAYDDPLIGKDPQPGHMKDYQDLDWDNGGVHINSGIPNRAFYLAAAAIGGHAWKGAGRIWYVTLRDKLRRDSEFEDAAAMTVQAAGELYGTGSREQKAVRGGWGEVGIVVK